MSSFTGQTKYSQDCWQDCDISVKTLWLAAIRTIICTFFLWRGQHLPWRPRRNNHSNNVWVAHRHVSYVGPAVHSLKKHSCVVTCGEIVWPILCNKIPRRPKQSIKTHAQWKYMVPPFRWTWPSKPYWHILRRNAHLRKRHSCCWTW